MFKIVVDANIWIKYARSRDIATLINRLKAYSIVPVLNNYLLSEVFNALVENCWMNENQAYNIILFIRKIALIAVEKAVYGISPDPKDNYLFDLAIQNNCVLIISDDGELLTFSLKPIPVHTSNWFIKTFPL